VFFFHFSFFKKVKSFLAHEALARAVGGEFLVNAGTTWGSSCLRALPSSSERVALLALGKRCLSPLESVASGLWKALPLLDLGKRCLSPLESVASGLWKALP
jgi:hypothetical protein